MQYKASGLKIVALCPNGVNTPIFENQAYFGETEAGQHYHINVTKV